MREPARATALSVTVRGSAEARGATSREAIAAALGATPVVAATLRGNIYGDGEVLCFPSVCVPITRAELDFAFAEGARTGRPGSYALLDRLEGAFPDGRFRVVGYDRQST